MKYMYDGTFSGFLTTVYEAYYHGISSIESVVPQEVSHDLFGDGMSVTTNTGKAEKVADAFFKACGGPAFRWLYLTLRHIRRCRRTTPFRSRCAP